MRDPADVLSKTFDAFEADLAARDGFNLPSRRSVQTGDVSYECEELIVQGGLIYPGVPGARLPGPPPGNIYTFAFDLAVHLVRCFPVGNAQGDPPDGPALTAASLAVAGDTVALTDAFWNAMASNSIADACDIVHFSGIGFSGPGGGVIGAVLGLSVQL